MLTEITPLILTFNEEANIRRTIAQLDWASEIVVVDSGSSDMTREILRAYPKVRVIERTFDTHAAQWNFGLHETGIRTTWVLALDADYVLSEALVAELDALSPAAGTRGYRASFVYCIDGIPLRGGVYPPVTVLFRLSDATYVQDGHTQRVRVPGEVHDLKGKIFHDDRKPIAQWLAAQARYAALDCEKLLATPFSALPIRGKVRRLVVLAPPLMFLHCLLVRGNLWDGRAGLLYSLQRGVAEAILSMMLVQAYLRRDGQSAG